MLAPVLAWRGPALLSILPVPLLPSPASPGPRAKPGCCGSQLGRKLLRMGCSRLPWDSRVFPPRSTGCCTHGRESPKTSQQPPTSGDAPTEKVLSERVRCAGSEPVGKSAVEPPSRLRPLKAFSGFAAESVGSTISVQLLGSQGPRGHNVLHGPVAKSRRTAQASLASRLVLSQPNHGASLGQQTSPQKRRLLLLSDLIPSSVWPSLQFNMNRTT